MHSLFQQASSLTEEVIAAAVRVQKHFGIGALESIYVRCLERELELAGHRTSREKGVSITYRGMTFNENLRYDLLVDDKSRRSPVCVWQRHRRDRPRLTTP